MTGTPLVGTAVPVPAPSGREPAAGVGGGGWDPAAGPFAGVDPAAAGAVIGFAFTVAAAGPAGCCSPLHPTPVESSFLELSSFL